MLMASAHFFKLYETPNWGFYRKINTFSSSYVSCREEGRDKHNELSEKVRQSIATYFPQGNEPPRKISLDQVNIYISKYRETFAFTPVPFLLARDILNLIQDDAGLLYQNQPAAAQDAPEITETCAFFRIPKTEPHRKAIQTFQKNYPSFFRGALLFSDAGNHFLFKVPHRMVAGLIQFMFAKPEHPPREYLAQLEAKASPPSPEPNP
jgi:hypothetical protein